MVRGGNGDMIERLTVLVIQSKRNFVDTELVFLAFESVKMFENGNGVKLTW